MSLRLQNKAREIIRDGESKILFGFLIKFWVDCTCHFNKMKAAVVVLGDIGRSPRMQYHSLSLANQANFDVHIVAYQGFYFHYKKIANIKKYLK